MKKVLSHMFVAVLCILGTMPAMAQFNLKKAVGGAAKAAKAVTLTDADVVNYVKEYIDWNTLIGWTNTIKFVPTTTLTPFV